MRYKVSGAIAIPKASWGCAPALPNRFRVVSLGAISECFTWNISLQLFPRNSCKILVSRSSFTRRGGLVRRLEKLSLFSPPPPCAKSMAHGFRCLRAAIRATRPEPRQHFWKIAGSKNFLFLCSAQMIQPIFHPANSPYLWQSFCIVSHETMLLENQMRAVRQNRFAVCLCAVRRWLCCPNWLWIFLRLLFSGNFFASWMANSICSLLLDCNHA